MLKRITGKLVLGEVGEENVGQGRWIVVEGKEVLIMGKRNRKRWRERIDCWKDYLMTMADDKG